MITLRASEERGHTQLDWLDSYHTFSFADYYDNKHMNFGVLRVINEDRVSPGEGFGTHPHRDMEIITYVIEGALEHKDSLGNGSVIKAGDVQRITAGTGVLHSEFNPSKVDPVHFLQIWIIPEKTGLQPGYEQKSIVNVTQKGQWQILASHDGRDGSLTVHQDLLLYQAFLESGEEKRYTTSPNRQIWLQVICGNVDLNGRSLSAGDGAGIQAVQQINIKSSEPSEILLFDLQQSNAFISFEGD